MYRITVIGLSGPIRCATAIAYFSANVFHHRSKKIHSLQNGRIIRLLEVKDEFYPYLTVYISPGQLTTKLKAEDQNDQ